MHMIIVISMDMFFNVMSLCVYSPGFIDFENRGFEITHVLIIPRMLTCFIVVL